GRHRHVRVPARGRTGKDANQWPDALAGVSRGRPEVGIGPAQVVSQDTVEGKITLGEPMAGSGFSLGDDLPHRALNIGDRVVHLLRAFAMKARIPPLCPPARSSGIL